MVSLSFYLEQHWRYLTARIMTIYTSLHKLLCNFLCFVNLVHMSCIWSGPSLALQSTYPFVSTWRLSQNKPPEGVYLLVMEFTLSKENTPLRTFDYLLLKTHFSSFWIGKGSHKSSVDFSNLIQKLISVSVTRFMVL